MCELECNVGETYVLPQALAFGLTLSTTMADGDNNQSGSLWRRSVPPPQRGEQPQLPRYTRAPHSHEENISVCSGNQRR
jgi:hypothetical protein